MYARPRYCSFLPSLAPTQPRSHRWGATRRSPLHLRLRPQLLLPLLVRRPAPRQQHQQRRHHQAKAPRLLELELEQRAAPPHHQASRVALSVRPEQGLLLPLLLLVVLLRSAVLVAPWARLEELLDLVLARQPLQVGPARCR